MPGFDDLADSAVVDLVRTDPNTEPIVGPDGPVTSLQRSRLPRLARHTISLSDGHKVGIAVCGHGVPLVVVHGYGAEGVLYAQSLSRLVSSGFKVVAIDTAGHGSTQGLPMGGADMQSYARLLGRAVDELGIRRAVFAGHSMGGRLVTELTAREPRRAIALILLDSIVGETWDRLVQLSRVSPGVLAGVGTILFVDTVGTAPFFHDPVQAAKLGRLARNTMARMMLNPFRMVGPGVSILRSSSTKWMLEKLGREGVPVIAIHGTRDIAVPLSTARSAARLSGGELVVVEHASHSWLLKDPETFPAIFRELLEGRLGTAVRTDAFGAAGLGQNPTIEEIEGAFYEDDAPILALTPQSREVTMGQHRHPPRYKWHMERPV